jgi:hypothetical protein
MEIQTMERPAIPSRRVWLDATQESNDPRSSTPPPPIPSVPVPAIPPEHAAAFQTPNIRRKSAPPGRVRTRVDNAATSPAVISSLIDSFTTLGQPETELNRSSPRLSGAKSTPATPVLRQRASFGQGIGSERTSLTDYEVYRQQLADELEEPQAAEPPVIRTSKRPSGKSEWTAPKLSHESSLGSYVRNLGRSGSSLSLHRGDDDTRSIGNVSIDSTVRRRSLVSISRESLEHRLGKKKSHSRIISPTREEFGAPEHESVRELVLNATGVPSHPTPPSSPRRRTTPFDSAIQEEPPSPTLIARESAIKEGKKPVHVDSVNGPSVPSRRSSLRHNEIPSTAKNRHSREINALHIKHPSQTLAEEDEPQQKVMLSSLDVDGEPTEVTKRIKDLKAKKELREREARSSLTREPEHRMHRSPSHSPLAASAATFATPGSHREAKAAEKKNRIAQLGAINVPPRGTSATTTPSKAGQNLTVDQLNVPQQPGTPLTPTQLPINYSYVVQTLSKIDSTPSISRAASQISQVSQVSQISQISQVSQVSQVSQGAVSLESEKMKSLRVGGRSAVARATSAKILPDPSTNSASASTSRLSSPEPADDRSSTDTKTKSEKPSRPNSLRIKRRRWSHPEVLPTVERSSSMKRHESLAVQPPARPEKIVEERPGSADSIDIDIKKFINHPRLSQKIRHPQTGRTIAFSEVGDPNGHAVFCCVGMGLTRYVTAFYDELAITLGLRLITPDRPGVGDSPSNPNALPLNWPGKSHKWKQKIYTLLTHL